MEEYKPTSVIERWALDTKIKNEDVSQCFFCKHKLPKGKCNAFRNGIPKEIKENVFIHTKPYEGDNGVCFEARKEEYKDINFKAMRIQSIEEIIATSKKLKNNND